jgi:hypothetical protein
VPPLAGGQARLLGQLADGGGRGLLDRAVGPPVARPGGDLQQRPSGGRAVLAHHDQLGAVDGDDGDGTGMLDDLPLDARAVGELDRVDVEPDDAALVDRAPGHAPGIQRVAHRPVL